MALSIVGLNTQIDLSTQCAANYVNTTESLAPFLNAETPSDELPVSCNQAFLDHIAFRHHRGNEGYVLGQLLRSGWDYIQKKLGLFTQSDNPKPMAQPMTRCDAQAKKCAKATEDHRSIVRTLVAAQTQFENCLKKQGAPEEIINTAGVSVMHGDTVRKALEKMPFAKNPYDRLDDQCETEATVLTKIYDIRRSKLNQKMLACTAPFSVAPLPTIGFHIKGIPPFPMGSEFSREKIGDINGDGINDILLSTEHNACLIYGDESPNVPGNLKEEIDPHGENDIPYLPTSGHNGKAYIVYGSKLPQLPINLSQDDNTTRGFIIPRNFRYY